MGLANGGQIPASGNPAESELLVRPHDVRVSLSYAAKPAASSDEMDRALALDPLSSTLRCASAFILIHAHHYDQAVQVAERAVREHPNSTVSHPTLASALGAAGREKEGFAEWLVYLQASGNAELARQLAVAVQSAPVTGDLSREPALITLRKRARAQYVSPAAFVEAYVE